MASLSKLLTELITEHGSATIQRAHIALLREKAEMLEKENVELKERVRELEDLTRDLANQHKAKAIGQEFEEESGVLLKRHPRGGYHKVPYCPRCKSPLGSIQEQLPFHCTQTCGFVSSLNASQFANLVESLP